MHEEYYEGILQLRNPNKEVIRFINVRIKENDKILISKQVKQKDGVDLYFSSKRFLKNIAQKLQKRFGGELKISHRLVSKNRQTSKGISRVNILYRYPKFKKGEIITHKGDKIRVLIVNKKVYVQDVKTGKKCWLEHNNFKI